MYCEIFVGNNAQIAAEHLKEMITTSKLDCLLFAELGGGYSHKTWVGVCGPLSINLVLYVQFSLPISDQNSKKKTYPGLGPYIPTLYIAHPSPMQTIYKN